MKYLQKLLFRNDETEFKCSEVKQCKVDDKVEEQKENDCRESEMIKKMKGRRIVRE